MSELLEFLIGLFLPKLRQTITSDSKPLEQPLQPSTKDIKMEATPAINWADPKCKISKYFTVKEALYLPSWKCYHIPSEEEKQNILKLATKMDIVREFLNSPISVSCWIRPDKVNCPTFDPSQIITTNETKKKYLQELNYNRFIGGAPNSAHKSGQAVDIFVKNISADKVRELLLNKLEEFDICVEDWPGAGWTHIDIYPVQIHGKRYFKP